MNNDAPLVFKAELRARPLRLVSIWLFLIVLPTFLLSVFTDRILSETEEQLEQTVKININSEMLDFRENLSFARMLDFEFGRFKRTGGFKSNLEAASLSARIEKDLGITLSATFCYDAGREEFSSHVDESVRNELGLYSRTMLKNLLIYYGSAANQANPSAGAESPAQARTRSYLRNLFSSPGDLTLKPDRIVSAISGKPGLGRLHIHYSQLPGGSTGVKSGVICIIRERDIAVKKLLEFAAAGTHIDGLQRSYSQTSAGRPGIYYLSHEMQQYFTDSQSGIYMLGLPSTELLLRLVTRSTLYPARLEEVFDRMPLLKVTAPAKMRAHPLREIVSRANSPALLLIMLASMVILRIGFFGYGGNLRIGPRLFVSVIAASLLPFSMFLAAAAYHQQFIEDFTRAEISQYIQLRSDQISKSVKAHISTKELQLAKLGKRLGELAWNDSLALLRQWLPHSAASLVIYRRGDQEETIALTPHEKLSPFELDAKEFGFIAMQASLKPLPPEAIGADHQLGLIQFRSKGLGLLLETVGTLHNSIANNLGHVYSTFPIFSEDKRFAEPEAHTLIRFNTSNIWSEFFADQPELLQNEIRGEYMVQNCFIPLTLPTEIPARDQVFCAPGFPYEKIRSAAEKTSRSRSFSSWSEGNSINAATYLHNLNSMLVIKATRMAGADGLAVPSLLMVIAYFILIVAALVIFLGQVLIEPIGLLKTAADRVAAGDFSQRIEFKSGDEFEPLTESFNHMSDGLLQKERLASYVSNAVLEEVAAETGTTLHPGGERLEVSVLFCSLAGFKEYRSRESTDKVIAAVGTLIETADLIAARHHGNIDKLIEDTLMVVFRQRDDAGSHVLSACKAALEISSAFRQAGSDFTIRAGVASGPAVSGKIGSRHGKLDYTVIGNPVNLAARLKAHAGKTSQTGIIICPNTIRLLKGAPKLSFIERTEIKGRSRTFPLYELIEIR